MKAFVRIAAVTAALLVATTASAQGTGKFGVGVGISDGGIWNTAVFVPMNIAPNLRVEPFLGIDRSDVDVPGAAAGGSANFAPFPGENSNVTLGAGVFFLQPVASQIQMYAGGRLGLQWESEKQGVAANPDEWSRRNIVLAAALGGEYLPHPRIAVGAEAMLGYISYGDTEVTDGTTGQKAEGSGGSGMTTQGTLFVRVYIF